MAIRAKKVNTIKALKASVKKSSGNSNFLKMIPEEGGIVVRFLTEPTEWLEWFQHFNEAERKSYVCTGDDCDSCANGIRASKRYLAAAVDVDDGKKVVTLILPITAVSQLLKKYEKYSTLMDRDYELTRQGKGLDTEYDVTPEVPTRMKLDQFDIPVLMDALEAYAGINDDDDDDDDDDEAPPRRRSSAPVKKTAVRRRPTILDEDEDEEDEDDEPAPRRRIARKAPQKAPAKKVMRRR